MDSTVKTAHGKLEQKWMDTRLAPGAGSGSGAPGGLAGVVPCLAGGLLLLSPEFPVVLFACLCHSKHLFGVCVGEVRSVILLRKHVPYIGSDMYIRFSIY